MSCMNEIEMLEKTEKSINSKKDKSPTFANLIVSSHICEEQCDLCGKILTEHDHARFYPEDGSYICKACRKLSNKNKVFQTSTTER